MDGDWVTDEIEDSGPDRMPGYYCMDVASNSEYFGYNVRSNSWDFLL